MKSNRKRKVMLLLILMACSLFLNGCWDKQEVEELAPLVGVGFDLGQKPGTFLITEQYALPKKGAAASEIEGWTYSSEVSSAREMNEMTSKLLNLQPFMGSLKVIVIGEDAAKVGFKDMLDFAQRLSEFRRSMYLVLAKGKAESLLNMKLRKGELPAMFLKSNIETGKTISTFPTVRLGHYLTVLGRKSTAPILPMIESIKPGDGGIEYEAKDGDGAQEARFQGSGVFREDRLIDFLTDDETKGYMWLENQVVQRLINTVGLEESQVNFSGQVIKSRTKYKVNDNNGTIELQYRIKVSISVDEVMGLKKRLSEPEWVDFMKGAEKSFAKVIQKECELSIKKERELGLDFLGIGRHIEQRNPAYWKTVKDHWEDDIADFPVSVNVEVTINHSGMSGNSVTTN
ncbi:Ger(x)C family spore germination protein [Desulfosporosinus sp. Sb-LF]|uniref:Ger(x)C family spore germination protein n=1 Tax=Desulfosporosinus sp. Sb-LF TaxID=2560027 RepID=UPI00107F9829|nr:Ger(x)C family spore germination protein [Desulfosporosinus sp. Sb-LF]TGE34050.1 Ger(x)C family spore germination protein [Desulfosporosinus sp. Sb-LF]